jgi:hypothetical protein
MKAITLTQPYASLVAIGAKHNETRSWATSYRGPLAIHAGKGFPGWAVNTCLYEPFIGALRAAGLFPDCFPLDKPFDLKAAFPRGAIVATCELQSVIRTEILESYISHNLFTMTDQERAFGDYSPGRYAWLLANVRALPEPIPAKGALGLWEWQQEETRGY